jgi:hypothetical protein
MRARISTYGITPSVVVDEKYAEPAACVPHKASGSSSSRIGARRSDARVAEGGALLRRYTGLNPYRGFESLSLRQIPVKSATHRLAGACLAAALSCAAVPAVADTSTQFWPELDAYFKLTERARLFLMATASRAEQAQGQSGGSSRQDMQVGAHLDVTLSPLFRPDLAEGDWQRNRYLWMRIGYRYGRSLGSLDETSPYREQRGIFELTARTPPLAGGFEYVGRFRWDARDVNDVDSNRYRLRLQVEKSYKHEGRTWVPFANAEAFYDTRYDDWIRERYQLGVEIELSRAWRLEPALTYQTDSQASPGRINALGLTLKYFH